jgi:uncharacterized RDD family membrane protein YckC
MTEQSTEELFVKPSPKVIPFPTRQDISQEVPAVEGKKEPDWYQEVTRKVQAARRNRLAKSTLEEAELREATSHSGISIEKTPTRASSAIAPLGLPVQEPILLVERPAAIPEEPRRMIEAIAENPIPPVRKSPIVPNPTGNPRILGGVHTEKARIPGNVLLPPKRGGQEPRRVQSTSIPVPTSRVHPAVKVTSLEKKTISGPSAKKEEVLPKKEAAVVKEAAKISPSPSPIITPHRSEVAKPMKSNESTGKAKPKSQEAVINEVTLVDLDEILSLQEKETEAIPTRKVLGPDRSILLSRILGGLVDFVVVLICSIPFFFTLNYLSRPEDMNHFTLSMMAGIPILIYHLYSLLFLCFAGQTVGMMIAEIQVIDAQNDLPSHMQAIRRTLVFLLTLFSGIFLLWPVFHRKCRGLQDILSGTEVVRVQDYLS